MAQRLEAVGGRLWDHIGWRLWDQAPTELSAGQLKALLSNAEQLLNFQETEIERQRDAHEAQLSARDEQVVQLERQLEQQLARSRVHEADAAELRTQLPAGEKLICDNENSHGTLLAQYKQSKLQLACIVKLDWMKRLMHSVLEQLRGNYKRDKQTARGCWILRRAVGKTQHECKLNAVRCVAANFRDHKVRHRGAVALRRMCIHRQHQQCGSAVHKWKSALNRVQRLAAEVRWNFALSKVKQLAAEKTASEAKFAEREVAFNAKQNVKDDSKADEGSTITENDVALRAKQEFIQEAPAAKSSAEEPLIQRQDGTANEAAGYQVVTEAKELTSSSPRRPKAAILQEAINKAMRREAIAAEEAAAAEEEAAITAEAAAQALHDTPTAELPEFADSSASPARFDRMELERRVLVDTHLPDLLKTANETGEQ